jgi:CRP-like cAMP-binding protein
MMDAELARRVAVLRKEYLFLGLDDAQVARAASMFELAEFKPYEHVFDEGDTADYFYIVFQGRARVYRRERRGQKLLNVLSTGDYFGEYALLFYTNRTASVIAETPLSVLRIGQQDFQKFIQEYPSIRLNLTATASGRKLARRLHFDWLAEDEIIYYITRKHELFLVLSLLGPTTVAFLTLAAWLFLTAQDGWQGLGFGAFLFGIPLLGIILWIVYDLVDWSNDYYIVTSRRVVWQEKVIFLYDSRREAPLNSVLAVNTVSSFWGRQFGYGTVEVRTYTGTIAMKNMSRPALFARFVEGYKTRVIAISKEKEAQEFEKAIETGLMAKYHLEKEVLPADKPPEAPFPRPAAPPKKAQPKKSALAEFINTFLKVRYQEGKVITYRKHLLVLLGQAWAPTLLLFACMIGLGAALWYGQTLLFGVLLLVWLVVIVWWLYEYVDWSNDIYRLTPDQIMDIDKKPLGREEKKTAPLDAQDFRVEHLRANLINIIFNYGNVVINVGQTQFTFDGVYNPDQVHQDVSDYRQALLLRKQEEASKREREHMVDWFVAYHSQSVKLENPENEAP